ncbi:hypothetical protein [Kineococcus terrestris]|uniref:hypothetical protein n=1 Tax=Kineococcus terrestris TaxID=2044856 RepID=UPI0034DAC349
MPTATAYAGTRTTAPAGATAHQSCIRRPGSRWTTCRCEPCKRANTRTKKLHGAGVLPNQRAAADARIDDWLQRGWTPAAIASATGLPLVTVQEIVKMRAKGLVRRLNHRTVRAVLTAGAPTRGHLSRLGARRRMQALTWMGWSLQTLSQRTGLPVMTLSDVRGDNGRQLTHPQIAAAITEAYLQLSHLDGGSPGARAYARRKSWAPPAAWDDESLDDPDAQPQGLSSGPHRFQATDTVVIDRVRQLHRAGHSDSEIAVRAGLPSPAAVQKLRHRNGIRKDPAA